MADIKRTLSELLTDYADNSVGAITPNKLRNGFKSVFGSTDVFVLTSAATYNATSDNVVIIYNYPFSQGTIILQAVLFLANITRDAFLTDERINKYIQMLSAADAIDYDH